MGRAALVVFLVSLAAVPLSLAVLVRSALLVYRSLRHAYQDFQAWKSVFARYGSRLTDLLRAMEERARNMAAEGREMRETVDDIRDFLEEMRHHPLLRTARLASRIRR